MNKKLRKVFSDAIAVEIPLDVTADLGVAIRRTRDKRLQLLYQVFPSLKKMLPEQKEDDDEVEEEGVTDGEPDKKKMKMEPKTSKEAADPSIP